MNGSDTLLLHGCVPFKKEHGKVSEKYKIILLDSEI